LKYFNSHPIELITGIDETTDQKNKEGRILKSSTIYLLPSDCELSLDRVNDEFIIDCSTKNVLEPYLAIESLVSNIHAKGFSIDFVELFNGKTDRVNPENSIAEITLLNYSYPALKRNILGNKRVTEFTLTEGNK
jgi:hypothetical protein